MLEKVKNFAKSKNNLIVLVLAGILLMVIALPVTEKDKNKDTDIEKEKDNTSYAQSSVSELMQMNGENCAEEQLYVTYMEEKLQEVLGRLDGAGEVKVLITLQASEEKIVEKDIPLTESETEETDSAGGMRSVYSTDRGESTVYTNADNKAVPYVVQTISPKVEGVVVLAEGAGTGNVSLQLSEAVQVLFGIEAHKIKVMKMEGTK